MIESKGSKIYIKVDEDEKLLEDIKEIAARQPDTPNINIHEYLNYVMIIILAKVLKG